MDWDKKLQLITDYVEAHLQREESFPDREEISKLAGCSFDFFQKVFSYMNGISFSEYVRSRKLTLAGYDVKSTNLKVVDISLKYGYDSPTSFTKAFQQFHGVSPRQARDTDAQLKVFPKMHVISHQEYTWRLEQKTGFRLIGKSTRVSRAGQSHYAKIPGFWDECQRNGVFSQLISMDTGSPKGLFGLFGDSDGQADEVEYSIMVRSDRDNRALPQGYVERFIPGVTWAIFDCQGPVPQAIQKGWAYLNEEWLSRYPFRHAECPELEWYSDGNSYSETYLSQIWIPIIEED